MALDASCVGTYLARKYFPDDEILVFNISTKRLTWHPDTILTTKVRPYQKLQLRVPKFACEVELRIDGSGDGLRVELPAAIRVLRLVGRLRELFVIDGGEEWENWVASF